MSRAMRAEAAIIGSGFSGAMLALILRRRGMAVALIERGRHPRFALGESTTPLADLMLGRLARRFGLDSILPLTSYGAWMRHYPNVMRGPKRGFSYFHHTVGRAFVPRGDHTNELMVAANPDLQHADTHWKRADVDQFLVRLAVEAGVHYVDETLIVRISGGPPWRIDAHSGGEPLTITADFVVDASGGGGVLPAAFGLRDDAQRMRTHSWSVFGHFRGVQRWSEMLEQAGGRSDDHPFPCDDAALHHVFRGGWMYVLRFDDGVVSAGFSLDPRVHPPRGGESADGVWRRLLAMFPSIAAQFADARPEFPIRITPRMQRRVSRAAGPGWALLPAAAGTIDALHSTGIALTLAAVERLAAIITDPRDSARRERLREYDRSIRREIRWIDLLVGGCYRAMGCFPLMTSFAMLYFVAAIASEHRLRRLRDPASAGGFLLADDATFRRIALEAHRRLGRIVEAGVPDDSITGPFHQWLASQCAQVDVAGLLNGPRRSLYAHSKLPLPANSAPAASCAAPASP